MQSLPLLLLIFSVSYLIGAIPFGYLIARARGVDIFAEGSGNIGATNVARVLGPAMGILVFVLDLAKGAAPVLLARLLPQPNDLYPDTTLVTAGIAAFLGHLFPVYLNFRGGKGVATGAGVVLVLLPVPMLILLVLWLAAFAGSRTVSLASLLVAGLLAVHRPILLGYDAWDVDHVVITLFCLLAGIIVFVRHAGNIVRLVRGEEKSFAEAGFLGGLARVGHVFSLGLWFGTLVCFTAVGYFLFTTMEAMSVQPVRPYYFRLPDELVPAPPSPRFPDPLAKEQGSRLAGHMVSPMFPWFFATQSLCAAIAFLTALGWWRSLTGKVRLILLALALVCVLGGWVVEHHVSELRGPRNDRTDTVLNMMLLGNKVPAAEWERDLALANAARSTFGMWHGVSMLLNLLTLLLTAPALVLSGLLPAAPSKAP